MGSGFWVVGGGALQPMHSSLGFLKVGQCSRWGFRIFYRQEVIFFNEIFP